VRQQSQDSGIPINHKIGRSKAFALLCLPSIITTNWAEEIKLILPLTFDQHLRVDVAHVGEMHIGQQIVLFQRLV
jgi:hypothetical protein